MADVQLNGIEFQIKGETKSAVASIDQLRKALSKLEKIHIKDFGLKSASKEIKEFAKAIDKIDVTKLTAFSKGLGSISGVGRTFEKISKNPEEFAKSMELLTGYLESISKIDFSNLQTAADGLRAIANSVNKITNSGASGAVEKTTSALARFGGVVKSIAVGGAKVFGKAVFKGIKYPIQQLTKPIKGVVSGLKTMLAGIGRIAMYRLFRTIIKAITQALQEGTKNLYQYSKAIGGSFAANMDTAATSLKYFKNSVAAAWSPLMNLLAPALDAIVDKVVAVINVMNQLIALLSGQTGWTKAVKQAEEYEDAAGGAGSAAKEAMKYLAPFDELNVLPDDKSGGGGGGAAENYSTMFEEMSGFSDFVQNIKDLIDAEDWQGLGILIGTKINDVIENINFAEVGAKVGEKINALFTTEYWTLHTINFQNIGKKIAEFLTGENGIGGALREIDFTNLGGIIAEKLTILPDIIIGAINNLDFHLVGQSIGDTIKGFFNNLSEWVQEVDWGEAASNLLKGIVDFISGLDLIGIGEAILGLLSSIGSAIASTLLNGEWINENIISPIRNYLTKGKLDFPLNVNLSNFSVPKLESFKKVWNSIKSRKATLKAKLTGTKTAVFDKLADKWTAIKTKGATLTANLANNVKESTLNWLKDRWSALSNKTATFTAKLSASNAVQTFVSKWQSLANKTLELKATISESVRSAWNRAAGAWNSSSLLSKLGTLPYLATGGIIQNGILQRLPRYAKGTLNAGSMFVAGESGAELVGHIGGRTEVLNKSQLASVMYSSIVAGISRTLGALSTNATSSASTSSEAETEDILYNALVRALQDSNVSIENNITLDGYNVYNAVLQRNRAEKRRTGINPMTA